MWKSLSENIKLIITSISVGTAVLGGLLTLYTWYMKVSDVVKEYPELKAKIQVLEEKVSGRDTLTPFITKQKFYQLEQKQKDDLNNIYWYKWPYSQWVIQIINNYLCYIHKKKYKLFFGTRLTIQHKL